MVFNVKPSAEHLVTAVRWPCPLIFKPTIQLLDEDLFAQLLQDFANVISGITFWDQIDRRLQPNFVPRNTATGWIGAVQPIQKGLLRLNLTYTVFSRFCGVAREKFFAFNKEFARIENSDE